MVVKFTPNIDRLAASGMRFSNFHVAASARQLAPC